jgi:hypothetical protein
MNYNSHLGDEFKMTHKCIHKQLDSEESLTLIKALVVQVMSLVSKRLAKQIKAHLMESLKDLLSLLKVKTYLIELQEILTLIEVPSSLQHQESCDARLKEVHIQSLPKYLQWKDHQANPLILLVLVLPHISADTNRWGSLI